MKNYITGMFGSLCIFIVGLIYLTLPLRFGLSNTNNIDVNDLFISGCLLYSLVHFVYYVTCITEPNSEEIILSFSSCIAGLFNYFFTIFLNGPIVLAISIIVLMLLISMTKVLTIFYFQKHKNPYYLIEIFFTAIFATVLTVISFNLHENIAVETLMLGFIFIIISILDLINVYLKNILKSKKFLIKELIR